LTPRKMERNEGEQGWVSRLDCCGCWRRIVSLVSNGIRRVSQMQQEHVSDSEDSPVSPEVSLRYAYSKNAKQAPLKERITVLLVDDNRMNLMIWQRNVEKHNCKIVLAMDGTDAVEQVQKSTEDPYDVIILDEQMPKMNGSEAARAIRELVSKNVLILSCSSLGEDIGSRNIEHFDGFLPKAPPGFLSAFEQIVLGRHPLLKRPVEILSIE